jgi:hypothetical protein
VKRFMVRRSTRIIGPSFHINLHACRSEDCGVSNRAGRRNDFSMCMRLYAICSILVDF